MDIAPKRMCVRVVSGKSRCSIPGPTLPDLRRQHVRTIVSQTWLFANFTNDKNPKV